MFNERLYQPIMIKCVLALTILVLQNALVTQLCVDKMLLNTFVFSMLLCSIHVHAFLLLWSNLASPDSTKLVLRPIVYSVFAR